MEEWTEGAARGYLLACLRALMMESLKSSRLLAALRMIVYDTLPACRWLLWPQNTVDLDCWV